MYHHVKHTQPIEILEVGRKYLILTYERDTKIVKGQVRYDVIVELQIDGAVSIRVSVPTRFNEAFSDEFLLRYNFGGLKMCLVYNGKKDYTMQVEFPSL